MTMTGAIISAILIILAHLYGEVLGRLNERHKLLRPDRLMDISRGNGEVAKAYLIPADEVDGILPPS